MKRKWIALLLCALLLLCAAARAEEQHHTLNLELLNDWVVIRAGAIVYRDMEMTKPWGRVPADLILQRRFDTKNGCTAVANGQYFGYVASDTIDELKEGDWLYAARDTRAYQRSSLNSRWIKVRQGLPMQLVGITGSCAMVRRGDAVAYMYIGHLKPIMYAWAVGA